MCSSAAVVHLLQSSRCIQRCSSVTLVVTSKCLSYCCLLINSKRSVHSLLTSGKNKVFSLETLEMVKRKNLSRSAVSRVLRPGHPDPTTTPHSKSLHHAGFEL